jgi:hypothetical protein
MLTNVDPPGWSDRQRRFLDAYREQPTITAAARLAGGHRATVHRWLADTAFAEALRVAYELFFQDNRVRVLAEQAERRWWREERERARQPMRCHYLGLARAAKRR